MSGPVYRPAKLEDLEGIVAMGDVLMGFDKHVKQFSSYLKDPSYFCFVMEEQGQIVSKPVILIVTVQRPIITMHLI
jgi:hypothetical protein